MTWPEGIAVATNVCAATANVVMLVMGGRRLRRARQQRDDLFPAAAVCLTLAHPLSPAPRDVKQMAAKAVPEWFRRDAEITVVPLSPSGGVH